MFPRDYFRELCQLYALALMGRFQQNADTALLIQAEKYFALAGETLFREVEEISVHSSREIFYDRDYTVLEQWLDARMQLYNTTGETAHAEIAFQIASQSKAYLLAQAMRRSGALRYSGVPDSIIQAELSLRERIVGAEKTLDLDRDGGKIPLDVSTLSLNSDLSQWRKDYDALLRHIEKIYPEYFRLRLLRPDVSSDELRSHWLTPGQGLLMYSLTGRYLYLFVLTRDTFCIKTIPADVSLADELKNYRNSLTEYFTTPDPDDALYDRNLDKYITLSQTLYRKLLLPVASLLPERIIIIPDGKLCYLPFESLLMKAPADIGNFRSYPFWAREKAISYALSTDFMLETAAPARKPEKNWLGLAPFTGNTGDGSTGSRMIAKAPYSALPFSGKEVKDIGALLQGECWLEAEARPGRFRSEAPRYRILHLATHSRADDRLGDYSFLVASNPGEPLPAKDLYQFPLAADMVVLSACEAGGGQLLRGEGIIGLVRAFAYAGARSTVASLWVANDQSTAGLMVDFYRNLRKGMPKDAALKSARMNMLNQSPAAGHPFFWAGFRVYGNVMPLW
jgi:CHAT domain-containing protein